jgi:hypothetical protein
MIGIPRFIENAKRLGNDIRVLKYIESQLLYRSAIETNPRYRDTRRLIAFGRKYFSQNDEDGIIDEILRRIKIRRPGFFVEIGVGTGVENNTVYRLLQGWHGAWIEANSRSCSSIRKNFATFIDRDELILKNAFVSKENGTAIFEELKVPTEFELLSIDVDGNDYYIWNTIMRWSPKIVVIEYNAAFGPSVPLVATYDPGFVWDGTNYFGASLKALELLGSEYGYMLVGCNFAGTNAFFVRKELLGRRFAGPFSSENHFEPPRYDMVFSDGHPPRIGPLTRLSHASTNGPSYTRRSKTR